MRTLVLGDVHGGHRALLQVFERSGFNYEKDKLIFLGDICDGWTETYECVEELMKVKNLVFVRGNHDQWLKDWLKEGKQPDVWTLQGGRNTLENYLKHNPSDWKRHLEFLKKTQFYYVDEKQRCFVHGGVSQKATPIEECDKMFLCWDRELWDGRNNKIDISPFSEVFVGHTSIYRFSHFPIEYNNVWFLDQGAGWEGVLTIMDVDTKKFWQSDEVNELYPGVRGR
jgi:serine/threonine protein phosphatase 1